MTDVIYFNTYLLPSLDVDFHYDNPQFHDRRIVSGTFLARSGLMRRFALNWGLHTAYIASPQCACSSRILYTGLLQLLLSTNIQHNEISFSTLYIQQNKKIDSSFILFPCKNRTWAVIVLYRSRHLFALSHHRKVLYRIRCIEVSQCRIVQLCDNQWTWPLYKHATLHNVVTISCGTKKESILQHSLA